jgi:hypothetical protein
MFPSAVKTCSQADVLGSWGEWVGFKLVGRALWVVTMLVMPLFDLSSVCSPACLRVQVLGQEVPQ